MSPIYGCAPSARAGLPWLPLDGEAVGVPPDAGIAGRERRTDERADRSGACVWASGVVCRTAGLHGRWCSSMIMYSRRSVFFRRHSGSVRLQELEKRVLAKPNEQMSLLLRPLHISEWN